MERRLYIIRHGKSSWNHDDLDDLHRPLAPRGTKAAATMAGRLKDRGLVPQLIFSSHATRALQTALIMRNTWSMGPEVLQIHEELYMAHVKEVLQVVSRAPGEVTDLAVFGHNPTFTDLANLFLADPLGNLPTAGVAVVTLDSPGWNGISQVPVKEAFVDTPKR